MKTLTIKCPICNKPMIYAPELKTAYTIKPKRLAGKSIFYCDNEKCTECKESDENYYTFDNLDNFGE